MLLTCYQFRKKRKEKRSSSIALIISIWTSLIIQTSTSVSCSDTQISRTEEAPSHTNHKLKHENPKNQTEYYDLFQMFEVHVRHDRSTAKQILQQTTFHRLNDPNRNSQLHSPRLIVSIKMKNDC